MIDQLSGPHIDGRKIKFPRGKVLGGSGSINGHLYVRGQAADYDTWAQLGCRGWSWDDVLPYFKRAESRVGGSDDVRGREGPLVIEHEGYRVSVANAVCGRCKQIEELLGISNAIALQFTLGKPVSEMHVCDELGHVLTDEDDEELDS